MKKGIVLGALIFLWPSQGAAGQRLSVEGGCTVPVFAYDKEEEGKPYGTKGHYGMANYARNDLLSFLPALSVGGSFISWSGPYTDNSLAGVFLGYDLTWDPGFFVRASYGPYYGKRTIRTATAWSFGGNLAVGSRFAEDYEAFVSFWHFSNGSALNIGELPNNGEEFLGLGFSLLFN